MMKALYHIEPECQIVGHDEEVTVGTKTLKFGKVPMLHWPDSSYTYLKEDKVLFSNDAFGQHFPGDDLFCDHHDRSHVSREMQSYTANIIGPFIGPKGSMEKGLGKVVATTEGDIDMICPSHGVIFRTPEDIKMALDLYVSYTKNSHIRPKVLVLYDSMYGTTSKIARAIEQGVVDAGAEVKLVNTRASDLERVATEAFDCACVAVGSPTINATVMPSIHAALGYLKGDIFQRAQELGAELGRQALEKAKKE
ncbi:hypothetical protein KIPB_010615 [Kipferlia bialata]|uniref:Flavodoxin-like domain-containing protein n=1 Tax=Kipferlia bialata TaxID=797122 RepID=A0A9K3GN18_9EUKA|nr:hypothetical protein KIPB_010615 [Kipferlia bialata]|eukprot:g10615.t1